MEGKWEKNGMGKMENSGKQGKKGEGNAVPDTHIEG